MAATRPLARLFEHADALEANVVRCGDSAHLPPALTRHLPAARLTRVLRRRDPAEIDALAAESDPPAAVIRAA